MKHTKGKWEVFHNARKKLLKCYSLTNGNGHREICNLQSDYGETEENEANFKIISKAPEMYEALKYISSQLNRIEEYHNSYFNEELRAANKTANTLLNEIESNN